MSWHPPSPQVVWQAIEAYLKAAYQNEIPSAVRARLDTLHSLSDANFYESAVLEHEEAAHPIRFALRLGNQFYPHMKLVIERAPDHKGYLFRADTHDAHCRPEPGSRDYRPFCQLMDKNQQVTQQIEAQWEQEQLPTFKSFLRDDLARRRAEQEASSK